MKLHPPFSIGPRLLPALVVGGATISLERTGFTGTYGKPNWRYFIDLADGTEHTESDLYGWGGTQEMFETLLSFLGACAESLDYCRRMGKAPDSDDNAALFPLAIGEWASQHSDEITLLELELSENPGLIEE